MANRPDFLFDDDRAATPQVNRSQAALERARADLERRSEPAPAMAPAEATAPRRAVEDSTALAARIDLLRGRLAKAREDAVSTLMFLGDAQQDCDAMIQSCDEFGWATMAAGVVLLSETLRRAVPTDARHLTLVGLLIDALYALRRAEQRADMAQAGTYLLHGLRVAVAREMGDRPV